MAHKNARFLRELLDTYKVYNASQWYYNGGMRPTEDILYKRPELIHRVKLVFGVYMGMIVNKIIDWGKIILILAYVSSAFKDGFQCRKSGKTFFAENTVCDVK